jgi:predicted Zn finger-like uncharacterized protein
MNATSVACPQCKTVYQAHPEHAGKKVRCANCNTVFVMPDVGKPPAPHPSSGTACVFCGALASGKFCSTCGSRLRGSPDFDFAACKIPSRFIAQFPSEYVFSIGETPEKQREFQQQHAIHQACSQFNAELDETARQVKYGGLETAGWRFNRVQIGRLVDNLPLEVPSREAIIARLWTIISDVERSSLQNRTRALIQAIEAYLKACDAKKAAKAIETLSELLKETPNPAASKRLEELRASLLQLGEKGTETKQLAAFKKLLD